MHGTGKPIKPSHDKNITFTGERQSFLQGRTIVFSFSRLFFLIDFFAPVSP
jgi:hypothetical protein